MCYLISFHASYLCHDQRNRKEAKTKLHYTVPTTLMNPFLEALPSLLEASHVYSPESDLIALVTLKFPFDEI